MEMSGSNAWNMFEMNDNRSGVIMTSFDPDWQLNKSLAQRNAFMFNNEIASDVHFIAPQDESQVRIPAHKFVLATASPVFFAMFYGGLASKDTDITIPDIEADAFLEFLRFLYCEQVHLTPHLVMPTLYAAKKYMVPLLTEKCKEFLETRFNLENLSTILNQSLMFEETDLSTKCLDYIDRNSKAVFMSDTLLRMSYESLLTVLPRDTLRVEEINIFESLNRWAENICYQKDIDPSGTNKRDILGKLVQHIRFPIMTLRDFANKVSKTNILLNEEINVLFQYFCCDDRPEVIYSTTFRQTHEDCKRLRCDRFVRTSSGWGYSGEADQLIFTVDLPIYILGLSFYGSPTGPVTYAADVRILEKQNVLCEGKYEFHSTGNRLMYEVSLRAPVFIKPGTAYIISARMHGPPSFYGQHGYHVVTRGGCKFEFSDPVRTSNGTGRCSGQIPSIIFCMHHDN